VGAWRESNFRLLFIGQAVSSLGNSLVPVALAFAVLDLTGSASDLGVVLGAQAAARVVFLLAGGVIADRMSRRVLMIGADVVRGSSQVLLGLLLVCAHPSVLVIAALGAVIGIASALFVPASTGLLPALVSKEQLQQANAMQQTASSAAGIAGPAIAGACVLTVGPGWAIILDGATFFVNVAMLLMIRFSHVPRAASRHWLRDLREGWAETLTRRWLRNTVVGACVFNVLFAVYTVLGPDVSRQSYHGAGAWTAVATGEAVGAVLVGLVASRIRLRHPLRLAIPASGLFCLAPLAFGYLLPVPLIVVAAGLAGGGLIIFATLWETIFQMHVPEELLSRLSSYQWFGALIAYPVGLAVAGPLAAAAGAQHVLLAVGFLTILETGLLLAAPSVRNLTGLPEKVRKPRPGRQAA
jgi:MFS family permease